MQGFYTLHHLISNHFPRLFHHVINKKSYVSVIVDLNLNNRRLLRHKNLQKTAGVIENACLAL